MFIRGAAPRVKLYGLQGRFTRSCDGRTTPARRPCARALHGSLDPTRTLETPQKKYFDDPQAALTESPIAHSVPRGITVPVGQPGGDSNLRSLESRNGSTGLSR